eukprot:COSAG02_NODE_452_length_22047_cov_20.154502_5_plen_155_part_00
MIEAKLESHDIVRDFILAPCTKQQLQDLDDTSGDFSRPVVSSNTLAPELLELYVGLVPKTLDKETEVDIVDALQQLHADTVVHSDDVGSDSDSDAGSGADSDGGSDSDSDAGSSADSDGGSDSDSDSDSDWDVATLESNLHSATTSPPRHRDEL